MIARIDSTSQYDFVVSDAWALAMANDKYDIDHEAVLDVEALHAVAARRGRSSSASASAASGAAAAVASSFATMSLHVDVVHGRHACVGRGRFAHRLCRPCSAVKLVRQRCQDVVSVRLPEHCLNDSSCGAFDSKASFERCRVWCAVACQNASGM